MRTTLSDNWALLPTYKRHQDAFHVDPAAKKTAYFLRDRAYLSDGFIGWLKKFPLCIVAALHTSVAHSPLLERWHHSLRSSESILWAKDFICREVNTVNMRARLIAAL